MTNPTLYLAESLGNFGLVTIGGASFAGLVCSSLMPNFAAITPDVITTWVGAITLSLASSIGVLTTAWVFARKKIEEANKASLSGQIEAMKVESEVNQVKVRDSLHEVLKKQHDEQTQRDVERVRHSFEVTRHADEIDRLMAQLKVIQESFDRATGENHSLREEVARLMAQSKAMQESFDKTAGENRELRKEVASLRAQIERLTTGVDRIVQGSSDGLPTTKLAETGDYLKPDE